MYIISKYKDYYDYISNIYGCDKSITYKRLSIDGDSLVEQEIADKKVRELPGLYRNNKFDYFDYTIAWLCICGYYYLICKHKDQPDFDVISKQNYPLVYDYLFRENTYYQNRIENYVGVFDRSLVDIHKQIQQPVFTLKRRCGELVVDSEIPKLKDIAWIKQNISPQQMWQNIYYFISNEIRTNPDKNPPVQLSNNDKIVKAGFDLKTSFRKRK